MTDDRTGSSGPTSPWRILLTRHSIIFPTMVRTKKHFRPPPPSYSSSSASSSSEEEEDEDDDNVVPTGRGKQLGNFGRGKQLNMATAAAGRGKQLRA